MAKATCPFCGQAAMEPPRPQPNMARALDILQEVAQEHSITLRVLAGKSQMLPIVAARRCAARRLRDELDLPLKAIGYVLGRRHHTTIINLIQNTPSTLRC